jgi:hypothetical protein
LHRVSDRWQFVVVTPRRRAVLATLIDAELGLEEAQSQVLRELARCERVRLVGTWRGRPDDRWTADLVAK